MPLLTNCGYAMHRTSALRTTPQPGHPVDFLVPHHALLLLFLPIYSKYIYHIHCSDSHLILLNPWSTGLQTLFLLFENCSKFSNFY